MYLMHLLTLTAVSVFAITPGAMAQGHHAHSPVPRYRTIAPFDSGTVRTYVRSATPADDEAGAPVPVEIGVEIPEAVVAGLGRTPAAVVIDLPAGADATPFRFVMLDWSPNGHQPAGIYDTPHFDFHFFMQDFEEVIGIAPGPCSGLDCEAFRRASRPVPTELLPPGFVDSGAVLPYMGNHLVDATSPELHGQPFTRTWLYGAYDGQVTFYEPMMTRQSLVEQPNECATLKMPAAYARSGLYPTRFCTHLDTQAHVYRAYLADFVHRRAR